MIQASAHPGQQIVDLGIRPCHRVGKQGVGNGDQAAQGLPQFPGGQGHGVQLSGFRLLIQEENVQIVYPGDGGTPGMAGQIQLQIQTASPESGVFLSAGEKQRLDRRSGGQGKAFGGLIDFYNGALFDAEPWADHQIQHFKYFFLVVHDAPPHDG